VAASEPVGLGGRQPGGGVGPQGLQHPVAADAGVARASEHGPVGQPGHQIGDAAGGQVLVGHHLFGRVDVERRGEHRQAQEQQLLLWREQVEGPVDDPAEGVVARVAAAVGRPEQLEPRIQPVGEVVDGQRADPRGGQLDRQREAVEGAADVANPLDDLRAGREVGVGGAGPVTEQPDRRDAHLLGIWLGHLERPDDQDLLAVHAEPLAAGREQTNLGGDREQLLGDPGDGGEQVLAVVDDQQPASAPRPRVEAVQQRGARLDVQVERVGDRMRNGVGVAQWGQIHPPDGSRGRGLVGQAGLADPARADQRDQPPASEGLADERELLFPADEGGRSGGRHPTLRPGRAGLDGFDLRAQHLLLQAPQLGRGVKAELVAEPVAVAGVGGQRVPRLAGLGKGGNQQLHGSLPPRLLGHDRLQRGRGLGQATQAAQQGRAIFPGGKPELLEAQRLPPRERLGELAIGRATPQRQRLLHQR